MKRGHAKKNPIADATDILAPVFFALRDQASAVFPSVGRVRLVLTTRAGTHGRHFAQCTWGTREPVIEVSPRLSGEDSARVIGILQHEFGHAIESIEGVESVERVLHLPLPSSIERRADVIAEAVFGVTIHYDSGDVQTTRGSSARRTSRPPYLPR